MQIRAGREGKKAHGKTAAETQEYLPKKEMPLGKKFDNSFSGMWEDAKGEYGEEGASVEFPLVELVQYLRQRLHDSVQQSPHSHRHLQQFQYWRDTEETKK